MALNIQLVGDGGEVTASIDGEAQEKNMSTKGTATKKKPDDAATAADAGDATAGIASTGGETTSTEAGDTQASSETTAASAVDATDSKRASGVGRIVALMERAYILAQSARDLANRWYTDETEKKADLKLIVDFIDGTIEHAKQAGGGAAALETAGWHPPASRAKVVEGGVVVLKDEAVADYTAMGIEVGMRLDVVGDGSARGTIWVKRPDGGKVLVAKNQIKRV